MQPLREVKNRNAPPPKDDWLAIIHLLFAIDAHRGRFQRVKSREVLKRLKADGWTEVRQVGSHIQLRHDTKLGTVTVPHPKSDLALGTLKSIEKQSGLKLR